MSEQTPLPEALAHVNRVLDRAKRVGVLGYVTPQTLDECRAVIERAIAALTPTTEDTVTDEWTWIDERQADAAFAQMEEDTVTDDRRSYGDIAQGMWLTEKAFTWDEIAEAVAAAVREREIKPWMEDNAVLQNKLDDVRGRIPDDSHVHVVVSDENGGTVKCLGTPEAVESVRRAMAPKIPDELVELLRAWRKRHVNPGILPATAQALIAWCDEHLPPEPDPLDAWVEKLGKNLGLAVGDVYVLLSALPESAREAMRREAP